MSTINPKANKIYNFIRFFNIIMCTIKVCTVKRHTLRKKGCQDEVVPYKKPVKAYYVIRALKSIGEYDEKK